MSKKKRVKKTRWVPVEDFRRLKPGSTIKVLGNDKAGIYEIKSVTLDGIHAYSSKGPVFLYMGTPVRLGNGVALESHKVKVRVEA